MTAEEGLCRYCGRHRPLIKAHIIPEAFFRAIGTGKDAPLLITSTLSAPYPKRAPVGVYDPAILCHCCERRFDKVDAYGTKTLLHSLRGTALKPLRKGVDVVAFQAGGIDQELLRRFFVATLWRASVSTHPFFSRIRLGSKYEDMAKRAVFDEPLPADLGVTIASFLSPDGHDESVGLMDPFFERYGGVNVYRFYFGPFVAYIKVDQRPFSDPLHLTALGAQSELTIIRRSHARSKDFAAMIRTARLQHENSIKAKQLAKLKLS